jgi:hypothetical protein
MHVKVYSLVPPRRIELPTPPLPIVYFLTIMNKNRQKLVLLGNAKQRFTVKNIKKCVISAHLL